MSGELSERALRWAFLYCTWNAGDPADSFPRPFAGRISSFAFNMLLRAVNEAHTAGSLPTLRIGRHTFSGMTGGRATRKAAADELVAAGLVAIAGNTWTLRIDNGEVRP
jgi:hypothetical protein